MTPWSLGRRLFAGAAFLGVLAAPCPAASWWRLPVWGAEVRVFAVDPFRPGSVFCGTSRGNFYGSTDGGESWTPLRSGAAFPGYVATGLVVDPSTPDHLWASLSGQYGGGLVVESRDRGAGWTVLARWSHGVSARALAVFPGPAPVLAVGGDEGVLLSRDGGRSWAGAGARVPGLRRVESLAFLPSDPKTLFAGTWRQAFRTQDGGASWSRIADGMVLDATVYAWDMEGPDPKDIWVSTCGWVYRTLDGGDHWTRFQDGFTNRRSQAIRRDPTRPGLIYAGTVGGLHRSTDDGRTWSRVSRESLVVTALEVDAATGRLYVGSEGEGVFYSDDAGTTLNRGSAGLAEGRVCDLVADPNDPGRVYFFRVYGGEESGVWEAVGMRVHRVSLDPLPPAASLAAFRDEKGQTVLLLSSSSGVRVSWDGGQRWSAPETPPAGVPVALFGAPFSRPILVTSAGVFRAAQGGRSFDAIAGGPEGGVSAELLLDADGHPLLEVRTPGEVFRWNGGGWSSRRRGVLTRGLFLEDSAGGYPAESYSSLQEVNGRLVWEEGNRRLALTSPRPGLTVSSAALTPGGRIYLGTTGDGLFLFEP